MAQARLFVHSTYLANLYSNLRGSIRDVIGNKRPLNRNDASYIVLTIFTAVDAMDVVLVQRYRATSS